MKPVLVILGPTAVGKTALSLLLARRLGGEVISADSTQVYRGMDIGTDKPPPEVREEIPHHLVDIRRPDEGFSAAEFVRLAREAIEEVVGRGKLPIVVGGTGLYLRALTEGFTFFSAPPSPSFRRSWEEAMRREGEKALERARRLLELRAPDLARRVDLQNPRRVLRALEAAISGIKRYPDKAPPLFPTVKVGLIRRREEIYRLIEERVEDQLRRGLVEEVRELVRLYPERPLAFSALGYKEVLAYLDGVVSYPEMVEAIKRNTRRFAKRQLTWFRKERGVIWYHLSVWPETRVAEEVENLLRFFSPRSPGAHPGLPERFQG